MVFVPGNVRIAPTTRCGRRCGPRRRPKQQQCSRCCCRRCCRSRCPRAAAAANIAATAAASAAVPLLRRRLPQPKQTNAPHAIALAEVARVPRSHIACRTAASASDVHARAHGRPGAGVPLPDQCGHGQCRLHRSPGAGSRCGRRIQWPGYGSAAWGELHVSEPHGQLPGSSSWCEWSPGHKRCRRTPWIIRFIVVR